MSAATALVDKFKDTNTLPHIIGQLSTLIADSDSTIKQFEDVIKMDPVLVARLLKLVNSPFFGLIQKVDSIARAVAFLGMKNLHNIAVTDALKTIFRQKDSSPVFCRQHLWLHCAAVSICSKMVAERIFGMNGDDAYLSGILHDFGLIVEEQVKMSEFHSICEGCESASQMLIREQAAFQTDHCEIGHLVTREWSMPENVQQAIRDHHTLFDEIEPDSLTGILQIAEYLTNQQGYSILPSISVDISPPLISHIEENLDEYSVLLEDFPEEMTKARELYGGGGQA